MRSKAWRRHHYQRLKKKRKSYWGGPTKDDVFYTHTEEQRLGMLIRTPHPCSCMGCGNKRRADGAPMQERIAEINAKEQVQEAGGDISKAA